MNNYPNYQGNRPNEKRAIIDKSTALIIALVILAVACLAIVLFICFNTIAVKNNTQTETVLIQKDSSVSKESVQTKNDTAQSNTTQKQTKNSSGISAPAIVEPKPAPAENNVYANVEDYVTNYVRPRYKQLHAGTGLTEEKSTPYITRYFRSDGTLGKVIVKTNDGQYNAERWFFYDEAQNLIFVYVYNVPDEHRYYYLDGTLVRYQSPDKTITDNPTDSDKLTAAYEYLEESAIYK